MLISTIIQLYRGGKINNNGFRNKNQINQTKINITWDIYQQKKRNLPKKIKNKNDNTFHLRYVCSLFFAIKKAF